MEAVTARVIKLIQNESDINEHILTLATYSTKCESIIELGVRGCVSSWAFLYGLLHNGSSKKHLLMNDVDVCNIKEVVDLGNSLNVKMEYQWCNDLELRIPESGVDMVFIDTWHIYGQLKRELAKFAPHVKKYIIMHDTEIDGIYGETIRNNMYNIHEIREKSRLSGYPEEEITRGLKFAIDEFLQSNSDWEVERIYRNNNGLTILRRKH